MNEFMIPKKVLSAGFLGVVIGAGLGWLFAGQVGAITGAVFVGMSAVAFAKDE